MGLETKRRRRSSDEVRSLLIAAARKLFRQAGYEATTTKDIAALAGVSETLVFTSFGSKLGLFDAAIVEPFTEFVRDYMESWQRHDPALTPQSRVAGFVDRLFHLAEENRAILLSAAVSRLLDGRTDDDATEILDHLARTLQAMAEIPSRSAEVSSYHVDSTVTTAAAAGMVFGVVLLEDLLFPSDTPKPPSERLRHEVTTMILDGVLHRDG
jgi:AcrR family transcriptional regulator